MSTLTSQIICLGTSCILNSLHFFTLQLIFSQCFHFHFLCSFPLNIVPVYCSEFCYFHCKFCEMKKMELMKTWFTFYIYYSEHFHWLGKSVIFSKFKGSLIFHQYLPKLHEVRQDSVFTEWGFSNTYPFKDCVNSGVIIGQVWALDSFFQWLWPFIRVFSQVHKQFA